ncbi:hypothetical protein V6N13_092871 [Hibiscus sabdariffa]
MFSGPVCGSEMLPTGVTAVKAALEIFKLAWCARTIALTLEMESNFLVAKINLSAWSREDRFCSTLLDGRSVVV